MTTVSQGLSEFLHRYIPEIEREMYNFLPIQEPEDYMYGPMRDYPERGGKRFRPALVLLACQVFEGDMHKAVRTAAAFEMFQSFAVSTTISRTIPKCAAASPACTKCTAFR